MDCTDLDRAEEFYARGMGLAPLYRGRHADGGRKSVLGLKGGHIVTLQEVPKMTPRALARYRGDLHMAVSSSGEAWRESVDQMKARGTPSLPDYPAGDGTSPDGLRDYYAVDPDGNTHQFLARPQT